MHRNNLTIFGAGTLALVAGACTENSGPRGDEIATQQTSALTWSSSGHHGGGRGNKHKPALNVQLGPRPYYLVEDMDEGPLKRRARELLEGPFETTRLLDRPPRRRAAVSRAHQGVVRGGRAHGRRHHRVRRDLHQGPPARLPPLAVRSAHHHQHPRDAGARGQVHAAVRARRPGHRHAGLGEVLHQRHHARRVQDACAARWTRSTRTATTVAQYLGGTPNFRTDLYSTCGTLMTHAESIELIDGLGRQVHARAQGAERADAVRGRLHPGDVRAADDRRVQGGAASRRAACSRSRSTCDDVLYWLAQRAAPSASRPCSSTIASTRRAATTPRSPAWPSSPRRACRSSRRRCGRWSSSTPATASSRRSTRSPPRQQGSTSSPGRSSARAARDAAAATTTSRSRRAINNDGDTYTVLDVLAQQGRHPRHLLRLARDRDLLRQLHGPLKERVNQSRFAEEIRLVSERK